MVPPTLSGVVPWRRVTRGTIEAIRTQVRAADGVWFWTGQERLGRAVLGSDPTPGRRGLEPGARAALAVDFGGLLLAPDRPAWLAGLAASAERVVHILPDGRFDEAQRVSPTYADIRAWFGEAADIRLALEAEAEWAVPARTWIVSWLAGAIPAGADDPSRKRAFVRPVPTVSTCMIVRDAANTILTTLASVAEISDEIRVLDTGSVDATREVVRAFAERCPGPVLLHEAPWPDDFAAARNLSVEGAAGDWILWIDADERLIGGERLRRLLQTPHWEAYAIRQHNHLFDAGSTQVEIPFRVYRNGRGYRFYGAVHEHPERSLNEHIEPWTLAQGVDILHYGYLTEPVRRRKLLARNLALLDRDLERYPGRRLTEILYLRDCVNLARFDVLEGRSVRHDHREALMVALDRFEESFCPERGRYYRLGRKYYDDGLRLLGEGTELAFQLGGHGGPSVAHRFRRPEDALWIAGMATRDHLYGPEGT